MAGTRTQHQSAAPSFGQLLRRYRRAAGLTQEELAERAGMAARSIRALEHGERRAPYKVTVEMLARALALASDERKAFTDAATESRRQKPRSVPDRALTSVTPRYSLSTDVPLVGRATELQQILRQFERVRDGCQVILLSSEAGGGKTRLLAEVAERARAAGAMALAGGCYDQEGRLPYGPIHDALLDYIRTQHDAVLGEQLTGIVEDMIRLFPELRGRFTQANIVTGDGESERLRLFAAIAIFIRRIAASQPLLIILDDLQSADDATLGLLHYLLRHLADQPMMVLGAYREEELVMGTSLEQFIHEVRQAPAGSNLQLGPLTVSDIHTLLVERLHSPCAESMALYLHKRSAGNPFFALQMLRLLEQEGGLVEGPTGWKLFPGALTNLPTEVRDTIARRFHGLPIEVRETLTAAAMLGHAFSYRALAAAWPVDEMVLDRTLDEAVTAHLLTETPEGYTFRHPLLREVICSEIGKHRRTRWHARIGVALETLFGRAAEAHASELAVHFENAGDEFRARAVRYLMLAGDISGRAFAWDEAREYYARAARLTTTDMELAAAEERSGKVLTIMGRYGEALAALERAAQTYARAGRYDDVVRTLAHAGATYLSSGRAVEGVAHLEHELQRLQDVASSSSLAMAYGSLAGLYHVQSRLTEQRVAAERAVSLARHSGDQRIIADSGAILALALINEGRLDEARGLLDEALEATDMAADPGTAIPILNNLAWLADVRGQANRGTSYLARAEALARQQGNTAQLVFILYAQARHASRHGDWQAADALLAEGTALDAQTGPSWASPYLRLWLGRMLLARGDGDAGVGQLREALEVAERNGDGQVVFQAQCFLAEHDLSLGHSIGARDRLLSILPDTDTGIEDVGLARGLPLLALAHLENGEIAAAEAAAQRGVTIARKQGYQEGLIVALEVLGKVRAVQGQEPEAADLLDEVLSLARAMQFPLNEANILRARANLDAQFGRPGRARDEMGQALAIYRRLGARYEVDRTERVLETPALDEDLRQPDLAP